MTSHIWEILDFERLTKKALIRELNKTHGEERFSYYVLSRKNLLEQVLDEIKKIQPDMTDHGPKHVKNVLNNIQELLGEASKSLGGMELYILCLSALFHDVGNVFAREAHQKQIGQIYDYARPSLGGNQDSEEKKVILDICKAHCGAGTDGSKNTLAFVTERSKIDRKAIRPNLLAPILRFADELAEGEQRTSHFMIKQHKYSPESQIFHKYADSVSVDIDRAHGRILLKYHITVDLPGNATDDGSKSHGPIISLEALGEFLEFVYIRIEKLNQERQYAKHYCPLLEPFKETAASFNFWHKGREIPVDLSPVIFSDLVVPGDPRKSVVDSDNKYNPNDLITLLSKAMEDMGAQKIHGVQ